MQTKNSLADAANNQQIQGAQEARLLMILNETQSVDNYTESLQALSMTMETIKVQNASGYNSYNQKRQSQNGSC